MPERTPERTDWGDETLSMVTKMLLCGGVTCLLGSLLAYGTGEDLGAMTSHFEATMVLGVLGVALVLVAIFPAHVLRSRAKSSAVSRDDWT